MTRILRILVWVASVLAVVGVSTLGFRTALSPLPATAVETEVMSLASRLGHTGAAYDEPTEAHPASVMPGLPIAALVLMDTFGHQVWLIRMLTLLALLGVAGIVASIVHVETENATLAIAAPALTLAGYVALGGQPGLASPEPMMLALVLAGFLSLRTIPGAWGAAIAAVLVSVACFTDQGAVAFAAAGILYLALEGHRRVAGYVLMLGVLGGGGYVFLSHLFGPWFNFYAFEIPIRSMEFAPDRLIGFVGRELVGTLGALTLATVLAFALPPQPWRGPGGLWLCLCVAALGAGLVATQGSAGSTGAALTCVAALGLVGPMALKYVTGHLAAWPGSNRFGGEGVMFTALVLQFVALLARLSPLHLLTGS